MNPSLNQCWENTQKIIKQFQTLGFTVHSEPKSNFTPTKRIEFLEFVIDSVTIAITLNNNKKQKLKNLRANLLSGVTTIKTISQILGKITSTCPANKFGRSHYRNLEVLKQEHWSITKMISTQKPGYQRKQKATSDGGKTILTKYMMTLLLTTPQYK